MPAISTIVSMREHGVAGTVGVDGADGAVVAGVHRLQHVQRRGVADLTDDDAVGAHAQGVASPGRGSSTAPLALDVGRAGLQPHDVVLVSWSSAASSIVTMRSSPGMNDDSTLSVVVLPAPVPPETTTLSRPRTQADRKSAVRRGVASRRRSGRRP